MHNHAKAIECNGYRPIGILYLLKDGPVNKLIGIDNALDIGNSGNEHQCFEL